MSFVKLNLVLKTDGPTNLSIEATCRRLKTLPRFHVQNRGIYSNTLSYFLPHIGEAHHSFQGGRLCIWSAPPSYILILHNRAKINFLILQRGLTI